MPVTAEKLRVEVEAETRTAETELSGFGTKASSILRRFGFSSRTELKRMHEEGNAEIGGFARDTDRSLGIMSGRARDHLGRFTKMSDDAGDSAQRAGRKAEGGSRGIDGFGRKALSAAGGAAALMGIINLFKFPAAIAGISALIGVLGGLTAGAAAAVTALGPLVGLLPALGAGALAMAQGFGVIRGALGGVGGALKAYTQQQDAAGKSAGSTAAATKSAARAQESAAQQVKAAEQALADARIAAAEGTETALRRVADAERSLERAQENARDAQKALTQARLDEVEALDDLNRAAGHTAIARERAEKRLSDAQAAYNSRLQDGVSTDQNKRDALLELKEAELDLADIIDRQQEQQDKLNESQRTGIEGSERVVDAQRQVRDANEAVAASQQDLVDAQKGVVQAQVQGARQIEAASRSLEQALQAVTDAAEQMGSVGAGAVNVFDEAMKKLHPSAQSLVRTLITFKAPLKVLSDTAAAGFLPGLERGLIAVRPLLTLIIPVVAMTAGVLGDMANRLGDLLGGPFFSGFFMRVGTANVGIIKNLGDAVINLLPPLAKILEASLPLVQAFGRWSVRASELFATFIDGQEKTGGLARFFETTGSTLKTVVDIFKGAIGVVIGFGKASKEVGDMILNGLGLSLGNLSRDINSVAGQSALKDWFAEITPFLRETGALFGDLNRGIIGIIREITPQLGPIIGQIRTELLPAILELFGNFQGDFLKNLVTLTTQVVRFIDTFLTATPILTLVTGLLGSLLKVVNFLGNDIPYVSDLIVNLFAAFAAFKTIDLALGSLRAVKGLLSALTLSGGSASFIFNGLKTAVMAAGRAILTTIIPAIGSFITAMIPVVTAAAPFILIGLAVAGLAYIIYRNFDTIKQWIGNLIGWVGDMAGKVGGFLGNIIGKVVGFVREWGILFLGPIGFVIKFRDEIGNILGGVVGFFLDLPGKIGRALGNIGEWLVEKGKALIEGLIRGIKAAPGAIKDALLGMLPGPLGALSQALGFGSPSKLFAKYGKWVVEGFANGIAGNTKLVDDSMKKLGNAASAPVLPVTPLNIGANGNPNAGSAFDGRRPPGEPPMENHTHYHLTVDAQEASVDEDRVMTLFGRMEALA